MGAQKKPQGGDAGIGHSLGQEAQPELEDSCWALQHRPPSPTVDKTGLGMELGVPMWMAVPGAEQGTARPKAGRALRSPLQVFVSVSAPSHPSSPPICQFLPISAVWYLAPPPPCYDLISFLLDKSVVSVVIYRGVVFFLPFPHPVIVITLSPAPAPSQRAGTSLFIIAAWTSAPLT